MKHLLHIFTLTIIGFSFSQQQIGNADMELWDNVGASSEEPTNWNSFKTASGSLNNFASKQVERSTAVRGSSPGSYCARIWAKSSLGVVANGNLTLGKINMGSTSPGNSANYNATILGDNSFSESCTNTPDSIVFWVKFTPQNGGDQARASIILHDSYSLRDPIDGNSSSHVVASAVLNYGSTGGNWVRKAIAFNYNGPASGPAYILATFSTNLNPGGGSANDEVLVDDIALIYNIQENDELVESNILINVENGLLHIKSESTIEGKVAICNSSGQMIINEFITHEIPFTELPGIYFIELTTQFGVTRRKLVKF